jgi:hypothetical protein
MTYIKELVEVFPYSPSTVGLAVKKALSGRPSGYRYTRIEESPSQQEFSTVIKPTLWPLLLSTAITVHLHPHETSTKVVVNATSQKYLMADVFDFYGRYLSTILRAIRLQLDSQA